MVHMQMLKFSCRGELRVVRFRTQGEVYGEQGARHALTRPKAANAASQARLSSRDMSRPLSTAATRL